MNKILELQKAEQVTTAGEETTNAWSTLSFSNCQNGNGKE